MKRKTYKRNFDYIVVCDWDKYSIDRVYKSRRHWLYLKDARKWAKEFENVYIFKLEYAPDSGDLIGYREVK